MTRARRFHPVPLALVAFCCIAFAGALSCYRPDVLDGGFKCNMKPGSKACPDGFTCDQIDKFCKKKVSDGGVDVPDVMDVVDVPPDVPDVPEVGPQCFEAKPSCDPSDAGARCDPFCQSGCSGCRQKCSVNTQGALTCNDIVQPGTIRGEFEPCTLVKPNTGEQTDVCAPGLVCLTDACSVPGSGRCYKFCRGDDCPNSECLRALPGGWHVCDVINMDTCVPTSPAFCANAQACYVSISRPTHTVCDCPGSTQANESCAGSRECFPGLLCVDPNNTGKICLRVCSLALNGADCDGTAGSCHPYSGNTGGAMVNTKFGYCF